jgi:hypothetical protein
MKRNHSIVPGTGMVDRLFESLESYCGSIRWGSRATSEGASGAFNNNILNIRTVLRIKTNVYQTRFIGGAWTLFTGVILYCRSRKKPLSIHGIHHHPYPHMPLFLHVFEQHSLARLQGANLVPQLPVAPGAGTAGSIKAETGSTGAGVG